MNKQGNQTARAAPRKSSLSAKSPDQNRMCGTYLLRQGLNSMNDIQRARLNKTMKESGLLPFI